MLLAAARCQVTESILRVACAYSVSTMQSLMSSTAKQQAATGDEPEELKEGMARILRKGNDVFYNEAQVTNRDLSVAVLRRFIPQIAQEAADGKLKPKFKPEKGYKGEGKGKSQRGKSAAKADNAAAEKAATAVKQTAAVSDQIAAAAAPSDQAAAAQEHASAGAAQLCSQQAQNKGARVLEGLAASGLRSIRYALELDGVARIDANDLDPAVVQSMTVNVAFNGPEVQQKIHPSCNDARLLMLQNPEIYDAIDLDPYGTPAHFLDSAVQAVAEGGLLAVTATDMAVLCGNSGEVCWTKYGSYPIHRPYCHEAALRILLACLESHANRYKRYIQPLLSVHMDFYIRVFVRVFTSAAEIKCSASKQAYVWQSQGCDSWWLQPVGQVHHKGNSLKHLPGNGPAVPAQRCPESGSGFLMGGPIWARPIHDQEWVACLLQQMEAEQGRYAQFTRIKGILTSVLEELPDVPLYYNVHDMCKSVRCTPPRAEQLRSAIINAGYHVSGSHASPLALKTDAPPKVVWDIIRSWVKLHPTKSPEAGSYPAAILSKPIETEADFRRAAGAVPDSVKQGVKRFVQNPAYWGPKARHGRPLNPQQQKQQQVQAETHRARQQQQQPQQQQQNGIAAAADGDKPNKQQHSQLEQQQEQKHSQQQQDSQQQSCSQNGRVTATVGADGSQQEWKGSSPPYKKARQEQQS